MKKRIILGIVLLCGQISLAAQLQPIEEKKLLKDFLQAIYAQRNQDPHTLAYLQQVSAQVPDSKYLKRIILLQALAENKIEVADQYANFIEQEDVDADDWQAYGTYLWKKGKIAEAEQAYQKAVDLDPDNMERLYAYLMLLSAASPLRAVALLEDLAAKYPHLAGAAYAQAGTLFLRQRNLAQAQTYFDRALQHNPDEISARLGKAEIYERQSQFFLMLHELEELERMGFGDASTYSRMASVFLLGKDMEKAKQYFLKAKTDKNDDIPSAYFLALLAEQEGDFESAIHYLQEAADYRQDAPKWLQVSFYQQKLNRFEDSAKTLEQAYKAFPDNVEIAFFYGLALQQIQDYKKAVQVYRKLVEFRPEYTEAWLQYAYSLESLKKYQAMETALRQVLTLQPNHAPALNLWAYSLAQRGIRLEEAQEYISRALAIQPQDIAFIDTQAWIYYKQGKWAQAADLLRSIPVQTLEQNPELAYHLGAALAAQGNKEQALIWLEKAKQGLPEAQKLYRKLQKQR